MDIKLEPNFNFQVQVDGLLKKLPKTNLDEFGIPITIDYDIYPNLIFKIDNYIKRLRKENIFSDILHEYKLNFIIPQHVNIPGKFKIFDVGIESFEIQSQSSIRGASGACNLKGTINTGIIFTKGKRLKNLNNKIMKHKTSCSMSITWNSNSIIQITFSFKFKFEFDRKINTDYTKAKLQLKRNSTSINKWLSGIII